MSNPQRMHLLEACQLAREAEHTAVAIRGHTRTYAQGRWDCGTACCIHGFAMLLATGQPASSGPDASDYTNLRPDVRQSVLTVLASGNGTPDLVEDVIAGKLILGDDVRLGVGLVFQDKVRIGSMVGVGHNVVVEKNTTIGDHVDLCGGAVIGANVVIGNNTIVGNRTEIGDNTWIGRDVIIRNDVNIGEGVVIEDDVTIDSGATVCDGAVIKKGRVVDAEDVV